MAWNEPGGNKDDKDPWGKRNDQGPPDLDEAFKKLQTKLTQLFGGSKGGSGSGGAGGSGRGISVSVLILAVVGVFLVWAGFGVYTLDAQERGLVLRFGEVRDEIVFPGFNWYPPIIDRVYVENVTMVRTIKHDSEMLTEDDNIAKVKNLSVQYVVGDVKKFILKVRNPEESLRQSTESAIRHVVGSNDMNGVIASRREEIAAEVHRRIQHYMELYGTGIYITEVNIDDTTYPDAVQSAVDDVIKAKEDKDRLRNEADAYSNQVIPEARGQAQRLLEEAEGYRQRVVARAKGDAQRFNRLYKEYKAAPEVTRERIYLDTMESVMSASTKVLIDVKGGNNLLYLPLDKLIQQGIDAKVDQSGSTTLSRIREQADVREREQRESANSRRERR